MAEDTTITLALDGEISLPDFAEAMKRLSTLVQRLTTALAPRAGMSWTVADLIHGSAIGTFGAIARKPETIAPVVKGYHLTGQALQRREPIPFPPGVRKAALHVADLAERPTILRVRFETHLGDSAIVSPDKSPETRLPTAYGAIRGTVQTLTNRRGLRFTLYDTLFDRPIACYLSDQDEDLMRHSWGREALVEGVVTRDPDTWRPLAIRQITNVELFDTVEPGSYRQARGALIFDPDMPAEKVIRRLRDGE